MCAGVAAVMSGSKLRALVIILGSGDTFTIHAQHSAGSGFFTEAVSATEVWINRAQVCRYAAES
jgi:hypothetical protein